MTAHSGPPLLRRHGSGTFAPPAPAAARGMARGRSACRAGVPAVEPERPWLDRPDPEQSHGRPRILAQARLDLALVGRFHGVQGPLAVAERAANDDHPLLDEPVHECRVLVPRLLLPDWPRGIPVRAVNQRQCEEGHGGNVPAPADTSRPGTWLGMRPGRGAPPG